ncbi:hypothetical protein EXIGLDRAFT_761114 [Exidia glandulosa HHB12029]|uniref:RCC1/BLIP-II protein n=1 Tax=Exidia glandulosa HHB12029 TaxID=1314781 RepID=A0A165NR87_EXIGL|nr:hypothetical protein EXIGLDRAFT_761114 [Exidia glandulosa HHB12029]
MLKQGLLFLAPLSSLATSYFKPGDEVTQRSTTLCHSGIRDRAFAFDTVEDEGQDDGDLLDTVVVVSVDGAFHGLNRTTGAVLWTTPSAAPLIRVISSTLRGTYAIELQTGAVFVLPTADPEEEEVQNLGISIAQLVDYSPYTLAEPERPKRIFVGAKKQTSIDIDIVIGELRSDSRCDVDASNDSDSSSTVSILRTGVCSHPYPDDTSLTAPSDYDVKVIAPNNSVLQQLSYSQLSTAHDDAHRQASNQYLLSDSNGYVWSFGTNNTSRKVPRFSHPM